AGPQGTRIWPGRQVPARLHPARRIRRVGRGAARLELLDQTQLAHLRAAEVRDAVRAVRAVPGRRVDGERPLVALVDEEERFWAAGRAQRVVGGSEQSAAYPAAGAGRMNE